MKSISKITIICFIACVTFTTLYSCKDAVKQGVKTVVKTGAKKTAKEATKKGVKTGVKQVAKKVSKKIFKTPINNGKWVGDRGNSKWIPDKDYIPGGGKHYANLKNKTWGQILKENNIDGIDFKNGVPDFDKISKMESKIDYSKIPDKAKKQLLKEKPQRTALHDYFYEKLAKEKNMTVEEIHRFKDKNNLVPHETIDGRIQLVPREIHDNLTHEGGVALFRDLFN